MASVTGDLRRAGPASSASSPGTAAWAPRPPLDAAAGCIWLPRLLSKARRHLESERAGSTLLADTGYMLGENDPIDAALLAFLRTTRDDVLALLRDQPDDAAAAAALIRRSGRAPEECAAWSASLRRRMGPFIAMIEADEGRRAPGPVTSLLRFLYDRVIMPGAYRKYRRDEARRTLPAGAG